MSLEQIDIYVIDTWILSMVALTSIFLTLLISAFLLLKQLHFEMARQRKANRGRRLRYKVDNKEVDAPALRSDAEVEEHYHLFLSYVP